MSTLAALPSDFSAAAAGPKTVSKPREISAFHLIATWALLAPLLFLAARGAFSFQYATGNTATAGTYGTGAAGQGEGSALKSAELIAVFGAISLAIFPVWPAVWRASKANAVVFLLPLLAVASTLWAITRGATFAFSLMTLILTFFGVYLQVRFSPRQQMQVFLLTGLVATLASFALAVAMPSAGIDHKNATTGLEGIYPHKGICTMLTLGFLTPAFFYRFEGASGALKRNIYIFLLSALTIGTMARTGWFLMGLVLAAVVLLKYLHRLAPVERLLVTWFLPAVCLMGAWIVYENMGAILEFIGKDPTFSGRTTIWSVVFLSIVRKPLLGFGFISFWVPKNPEVFRLALAAGDAHLSNAENGVLQMWLDLGLVGVGLLLFMLARTTKNAIFCFRGNSPGYALWYMSILFLMLLALIDGEKYMLPTALEWPMYIMADIGLANEVKRLRQASAMRRVPKLARGGQLGS